MVKEELIKFYFYITSGQALIDKFKYTYFVVLGVYLLLKLDNYLYLIGIGVLFIPVLFVLGIINIHYISKTSEMLSIKHGTHYGIKQFELTEQMVELLERIADNYPHTKKTKKS